VRFSRSRSNLTMFRVAARADAPRRASSGPVAAGQDVSGPQFEKIPPRVDYELTALGCSLRQIVEPLDAWARTHMNDMKRARETYDKRDET
jgi:hypothetical protein